MILQLFSMLPILALSPNAIPLLTGSPPVAVDDAASVGCNTIVGIDVLGNDYDPDGDPLVIDSVSSPGGANAQNAGTYIEFDSTVSGTFPVYYQISDGNGGTASATLTVTVRRSRICDNWPG
ncbi:cadherin-like domain-containing protein [Sphingomonas sp. HF-S4]|uniref:Cadherin-like domain-containing protein n=1 Tax=Sphingomonas agrestis TaxID=3080540 RepID=A0ABU3YDD2_9SPHN|nr:cadherin-like domain-containing protein [Sphingomonas sp. HF-S4]MDV3459132.1 cadherin-like domain-containing protein [Sphingomonas sp. HF-S4]